MGRFGRPRLFALLAALSLCACGDTGVPPASAGKIFFPKIDRRPGPDTYDWGALAALPDRSPESGTIDLRSRDIRALDLSKALPRLLDASFDEKTVWPPDERMPKGFDRARIVALGKNPGLRVRELHARGITGQGVGIAIIDQPLLTDHQEYASRLRLYEETDDIVLGRPSQMHGSAVASIAVGSTVGVAPKADLYYIATFRGRGSKDFGYLARCVRRILQINEQLPQDRKIRVIAMAIGWNPKYRGYKKIAAAVEEAKRAGMLVVSSSIEEVHGYRFHGLGRGPLSDPDDFASFEPGSWWAKDFYARKGFYAGKGPHGEKGAAGRLLIPMDSRTPAGPQGKDEYVFYRGGGWSWSIPYIAGLYALAAQVDVEITPDRFWALALKTGRTIKLEHDGKAMALGPIVDPAALVKALRKSRPERR